MKTDSHSACVKIDYAIVIVLTKLLLSDTGIRNVATLKNACSS